MITPELSTYKKSLKPSILAEAMKSFTECGIRAVKMDDIAKNLGISKRTLYEIYSNKEDVLADVVKYMLDKLNKYLREYAAHCDDTIDVLLEAIRLQIEYSVSTHADFFNDLHRYPEAEKQLEKYRKGQEQSTREFFQKGVIQGYFRKDVDYEIFHRITGGSVQMIRTGKQYMDLTYQDVFKNYLSVVIRGICTPKGVERLDRFVEMHVTPKA